MKVNDIGRTMVIKITDDARRAHASMDEVMQYVVVVHGRDTSLKL